MSASPYKALGTAHEAILGPAAVLWLVLAMGALIACDDASGKPESPLPAREVEQVSSVAGAMPALTTDVGQNASVPVASRRQIYEFYADALDPKKWIVEAVSMLERFSDEFDDRYSSPLEDLIDEVADEVAPRYSQAASLAELASKEIITLTGTVAYNDLSFALSSSYAAATITFDISDKLRAIPVAEEKGDHVSALEAVREALDALYEAKRKVGSLDLILEQTRGRAELIISSSIEFLEGEHIRLSNNTRAHLSEQILVERPASPEEQHASGPGVAPLSSAQESGPPSAPTATGPVATKLMPTPVAGTKYLIAFVSDRDGNQEVYVAESDGRNVRRLTFTSFTEQPIDWSPDGKKLAYQLLAKESDRKEVLVFTMNADGSDQKAIIGSKDGWPRWSPDGTKIAFDSRRDGNWEIYIANVDGSESRRVTNNDEGDTRHDWSPDGRYLVYQKKRDDVRQIYLLDLEVGTEQRLTSGPASNGNPAFSPDGKLIAYNSSSGPVGSISNIFLLNLEAGQVHPVTKLDKDACCPRWSPDGAYVYFSMRELGTEDWDIFRVSVEGGFPELIVRGPGIDARVVVSPFLRSRLLDEGAK